MNSRDLAARNVLVTEDGTAKVVLQCNKTVFTSNFSFLSSSCSCFQVSSFGLTSELGISRTSIQKPPVKWTAPEALKDNVRGSFNWSSWFFFFSPFLHLIRNSPINQMCGVLASFCGRCTHTVVFLIPEWWVSNQINHFCLGSSLFPTCTAGQWYQPVFGERLSHGRTLWVSRYSVQCHERVLGGRSCQTT